jgi:DNA-binding transcriptional LysR family regulator
MWQTIELREIRVFLTLAEERHFGRTAERLGLTQSRVSQTLRALETRIGDRLVDRTSRRVTVTPAGERLRGELDPAYRRLRGVLERFARASHALAGAVRLGVAYHAAIGPELLRVIAVFEARQPECTVEIVELPFRDRLAPLRRGEVDLVVTRLPIEQPDLVVGPIVGREQRVLAVARDHPLAGRQSVSLEDVASYQVIGLTDLGPKEIAAAYVPEKTPSGRRIRRLRVSVRDFTDLVILVARGRVVQPTVASAASRFAHPNVVCLPMTDMPPSSTALVWRRGARDPRLRALVDVAREVLRAARPSRSGSGRPTPKPRPDRQTAWPPVTRPGQESADQRSYRGVADKPPGC